MKFGAGGFLAFYCSVAVASPTPNEFLPCHQMAASVLMKCLDQNPGYADDHCWDAARHQNAACYAKVQASHQPDRERIEAAKEAMEKHSK